MFDKIKDLNRIRKTQGEIKKELEQIFVTTEKFGMRIVVRGDKKIEKLEIDGGDNKQLRELLDDTFKEVDKKVEKQTRNHLKDLGIPGL